MTRNKIEKIILLALMIVCFNCVYAQKEKHICEYKYEFKKNNNFIIIEIPIGDSGNKYNFLVDSGSSISCIDINFAKKNNKLNIYKKSYFSLFDTISIETSAIKEKILDIEFKIKCINLENINKCLDSDKIIGILGNDFLCYSNALIDYENQTISFKLLK